ncbi:MAG: hypothetical protein WCY12_02835 [Candidatus Omnitrophota bacterium]
MHWADPIKPILFWPLAAITIPHFLWAVRQEIYGIRAAMFSLVMLICVSIAAGFSLGSTWPGSWVIIFPSIYAIFYMIGSTEFKSCTVVWQRPWRLVGGIGLFLLTLIFTFRDVWLHLFDVSYGYDRVISELSAIPDHIITLLIVATAVLLFYDNIKRKNITVALFGALPLLAIFGFFVHSYSLMLLLLIFNIYLLVLSIRHIAIGIRGNNIGTVNIGMLMLAILIMSRFFDSNIGFVMKGVAFIIIGIGFLTANAMLARRIRGVK